MGLTQRAGNNRPQSRREHRVKRAWESFCVSPIGVKSGLLTPSYLSLKNVS
jgi:hypothetical protein